MLIFLKKPLINPKKHSFHRKFALKILKMNHYRGQFFLGNLFPCQKIIKNIKPAEKAMNDGPKNGPVFVKRNSNRQSCAKGHTVLDKTLIDINNFWNHLNILLFLNRFCHNFFTVLLNFLLCCLNILTMKTA